MKTYKQLRLEFLGMAQRKAVGRRMALIAKKASTKLKKARMKLKAWPKKVVHQKAQKAVRKFVMQKLAGKGKDLSDMSSAQKEKLEVKVDKKMKAMGGKVHALVGKLKKKIIKKHNLEKQKAVEKK